MRKVLSQGILLAVVAVSSVAIAGCSQYNGLKAKRMFRDANGLYQASDYKSAAAKYEQVVALPEDTLKQFNLTPACGQAYVATSLRLADTGDVRAVAEMQDGALLYVLRLEGHRLEVSRHRPA